MSLNLSDFQQAQPLDAPVVEAAPGPGIDLAPVHPDPSLFARAILFVLGGAFLGALAYALFVGITHITLGYLAILVAYLVAKGMTIGSRGQGGRNYQVAALILTYLAVSAAHSAIIYYQILKTDNLHIPLNLHNLFELAKLGILSPFTRFQDSGASALIGLFILFIGLRAAWRMTSGIPGAVHHPFAR